MADVTTVPKKEMLTLEVEEASAPIKYDLAEVDRMLVDDERAPEARGTTEDAIPRSYWYSARFLGTFTAIILSKDAGSGGFSLAAPLLSNINAEIGPDLDITWVSLSWTLTQGISTLLVGRLSDLFGRRWIFILGNLIGTIGAIFASQAQTVKQLIGATVLLGIAGGSQISYFWTISEIVPMRWRYVANAFIYVCSFTTWLGPKIAYSFQTETTVGWRGCYYLLIALNGLATICYWAFYHPPTFKMLHRRTALKEMIVSFDWLGLILYTAGFTVFLMGLTWGGGRYPWSSSYVIGSLVAGAVGLVLFVLWDIWLPRRSQRTIPLVEMHFFKNFQLMAITGMTCVAGSTYYGFSSVWPGLVRNVWTGLDAAETGNMLCVLIMCYLFAQCIGGCIAHFTGPKYTIIISMCIACPLLTCAAVNPFNMTMTASLACTGGFALGIMEGVALTATTYPLRTQEEIGSAGGLTGTLRLFVSTIATCIYNTTLVNRLNSTIPENVGRAATSAGLPVSSLPLLISNLRAGHGFNSTSVPGINDSIEAAAKLAFRMAYSDAYRTMFLVSLAFTGPGVILCWFVAQHDKKKEHFVAGHLHDPKQTKTLEQQDG
ncbi:hypothetical protein AYL99_08658 [Fonsecaea erecta]|uniref:Major facilitator superfamily (MFS) profile domain-containing protein n=1 Tax=Fonsecaea erecta TaxID=1367422 RepID=A0A178ZDM7_9EURO|nr:hypothetical protein AYL99_08658 [Fonsecaea erecta]OAP57920.1 hypothetical protein AYL99_08658 [Fonsecaea erecta]